MKTITKNGYEITVVDRVRAYYSRLAVLPLDLDRLSTSTYSGIKIKESLKNKKPRD